VYARRGPSAPRAGAPAARRELRQLLEVYKPHRPAIYTGEVEPIAAAPNNASHSGLRCVVDEDQGYLLCFREIENPEPAGRFTIPGLAGRRLDLEDLVAGRRWTAALTAVGDLPLTIERAPDFRFLRYRIIR
jgi:hypothetical protein